MDITLLILACKDLLLIEKPVDITFKTNPKGVLKEVAGLCDTIIRKGKIIKHSIKLNARICFESEFKAIDVIAHEMVHACMIEKGSFNPEYHHDTKFQNICRELEKELTAIGFPVGSLYSPETDIE